MLSIEEDGLNTMSQLHFDDLDEVSSLFLQGKHRIRALKYKTRNFEHGGNSMEV